MNIAQALQQQTGQASVKGWVYRERSSKTKVFLVLRDTDDVLQCVVHKDKVPAGLWDEAQNIKVEASVEVSGTLGVDERAPGGVELSVDELRVVGSSNEFPITKDQSAEHLANYRHLWLRSRKMNAILKIRSTVFAAFREYFDNNGFYEYHSPIFQASHAEGGSDLFSVKYFDTHLYLSQSWQLYAEAGIFSLEKIYTVAPTFRAEKSKTSRHVTEFWMAEMEEAWTDFDGVIAHGQGVIQHIVRSVIEKNLKELEVLEVDVSSLRPSMEKDFPRMTYTDALKVLQERDGLVVPWGKDLRTVEEDLLSQHYDTPIIVTHYPKAVKAFYMKEDADDPRTVLGVDFIAPRGYGEIIGGSQREDDLEKLKARVREQGEELDAYEYYLDTRRYGTVPHGGFGLGIERVIAWICGLDTIKDAIAFPRTPLRYTP